MTDTCNDCLFSEVVEDEDYMACQARQMLVMPFDKVCDYFEARGCVCKECTTMEPVKEAFTNSTASKLFECDCDECCNANSYSKLEEDEALDLLLYDLKDSYLGVLETMTALEDGGKTKDVLLQILGMESTIALIKRYLLEIDDQP